MARRGSGRAVTAVNGSVALSLVLLLAVVALVVKPPAPPGIAEFAPQAAKPITIAPEGQSAHSGIGKGVCAAGQNCTPPSASPTHSLTPRPVSTDVGVPPGIDCHEWPSGVFTQTFDPQSPPCIAAWPDAAKGNGGATTRGVTRDEIRITVSQAMALNGSSDQFLVYMKQVVAFINSHYQLYGRRLVLVVNNGPDAFKPSDAHAAAQAALATRAFAALYEPGNDSTFGHELAQGHMISVTEGTARGPATTAARLRADAPYAWSYEPPMDVTQRNLAAFVCTSLKGKRARLSTEDKTRERKFRIVNQRSSDGPAVDPRALQDGLRSCGIDPGDVITIEDTDTDVTTKSKIVTDLRAAGVTTILNLAGCCNDQLENAASKNGWHPEWVYYGMDRQYPGIAQKYQGQGAEGGRIGLAPTNKLADVRDTPYYQAAPSSSPAVQGYAPSLYYPLALLAAGIQMAGPNLTPATFAQGLHGTTFPNPGAAAAPWYQAAVGFPGDDPWMIRDYAVWWPNTRQGPDAQRKLPLCFADLGRRWHLGGWKDMEARVNPGGLGGC